MRFVERYRAGEQLSVWQELLQLGARVRQEPLHTEAMTVAHEAIVRLRAGLEAVVARLRDAGYAFAKSNPLKAPDRQASAQLEYLTRLVGPLPLCLHAWYQAIGEVDLRGTHAAWRHPGPLRPDSSYIGLTDRTEAYTDPVCVSSLASLCEQAEARASELEDLGPDEGLLFTFAGDLLAKNGTPGGVYALLLPEPGLDTDVEAPGPTTFVGYLRHCLHWAGFPGWAHYQHPPIDLLKQLRANLQPF